MRATTPASRSSARTAVERRCESFRVLSLPLGLGIGPIDLPKFQQQVLDLGGEPVLHFHEPAAGVGQDGVQLPGLAHGVGREGIAHLDGGREVLGPVLQPGYRHAAGHL